jgi:hypothetical protein
LSPPEGRNVKQKAGHFGPMTGGIEPCRAGVAARLRRGDRTMFFRSWLAALAVLFALGAAQAATEECPAKSTDMDDIIAALRGAPGCDRAMKIFQACEYGAGLDVQFGAVVEQKCEADFLSGLGASEKKAYASELGRCDAKYRNESGTMYRSFTAFCRAEVSQRYSQKALKAGPKTAPKTAPKNR